MKKLFSLLTAVLTAMTMFAADVEFGSADFNGQGVSGTGGTVTATKNGVTFSCDKAYGDQYGVRCYKNSVVTISANQQIGKIVFEFATVSGKYYNGDLAEEIAVDATEWTNTMTNQARMNKISIYFGSSTDVVGEVYDTLNVAAAIEAAAALADNAQSDRKVYVEGFAVDVQAYSPTYNNQIFFMADDAANTGAQVFEAYAAAPKKDGQVYPVVAGDQVRAFGYLKKYVKNGETTLEIVNPAVEFIVEAEGDRTIPEIQYDTITVAEAIEITMALEDGGKTSETYVVKGFAGTAYAMEDGQQTWYMADEPDVYATFQAAKCTPDREVVKGDFMLVKGVLTKYKSSKGSIIPEIYLGTAVHAEAPAIDTILVNVAEALTVAGALEPNAVADGIYGVRGLVSQVVYEFEEGVETFYMVDALGSADKFYAFKAKLDKAVAVGDEVVLVGKIKNYEDPVESTLKPQIDKGTVIEINGEKQGIENIVLTEQARKVMVEGQIFIIRDNKLFNLQGAQVR